MRVLTHSSGFQVANNHFAHFFAPQNLTNLNKNLVFVIDISTSMEGQKVKQVTCALKQFTQRKLLQPIPTPHWFCCRGGGTLHRPEFAHPGACRTLLSWPPPAIPSCLSTMYLCPVDL